MLKTKNKLTTRGAMLPCGLARGSTVDTVNNDDQDRRTDYNADVVINHNIIYKEVFDSKD